MKLIAIVFTEWRDAGYSAVDAEAASARVATCKAAESALIAEIAQQDALLALEDGTEVQARKSQLVAQLGAAMSATKSARQTEAAAAQVAGSALKSHAMVGKAGFQVLSDDGSEVEKVVDADGNDLPAGAVYGYRVAAPTDPVLEDLAVLPAWAAAQVKAAAAAAVS